MGNFAPSVDSSEFAFLNLAHKQNYHTRPEAFQPVYIAFVAKIHFAINSTPKSGVHWIINIFVGTISFDKQNLLSQFVVKIVIIKRTCC